MKMKAISFKIEEELLQELDLYAHNSRNTRSDVIREAIKLYLSMKKSIDSKPGSLPPVSENHECGRLTGRVYRKKGGDGK